MNFKQRLLRYLVGFLIGVLIVFMMFPEYDWLSWLPNKQVMKNVRENQFYIAPEVDCKIKCMNIDSTNLQQGMNIDSTNLQQARLGGKIIFSKSDVKRIPKTYFMEYGDVNYTLEMTDSTVTLIDVMKLNVDCPCQ